MQFRPFRLSGELKGTKSAVSVFIIVYASLERATIISFFHVHRLSE
jgi:hypothetical protein